MAKTDVNTPEEHERFYVICTPPRSGSYMLCSLLALTGEAGMPNDIYEAEIMLKYRYSPDLFPDWEKVSLEEFFLEHFRAAQTQNGIAGFKIIWQDLQNIQCSLRSSHRYRQIEVNDLGKFFPAGTRFLWMQREDKLRQAISMVKAIQTDAWTSGIEKRPGREPVYFYSEIRYFVEWFHWHERCWESFFEINNIQPFVVLYERMAQDVQRMLDDVVDFLGIRLSADIPVEKLSFKKQADGFSEDWAVRFRSDGKHWWARFWFVCFAYRRIRRLKFRNLRKFLRRGDGVFRSLLAGSVIRRPPRPKKENA